MNAYPYFYPMKMVLCSVGKPDEPYVKAGIVEFTQRLNKYVKASWHLIAAPKNAANLSELDLKKAESQLILSFLQKEDYLVLLDERGKQLSSPALAQFIQQRANDSTKRVVFLIGGAFGVDETIKQRANLIWSLSQLVFPHMLVRLVLCEQVYRAFTILKNEKYHHN